MSVTAFAAPDYVREKKWADEIIPGIAVGNPVYLEQKNRHKFLGLYTEGTDVKGSVVVVHGKGVHPDSGIIGALRQRLSGQGYTTLSVQMPVLAEDAKYDDYLPVFPEAVERLQLAVSYLKGKGYKKIAIVSHSIGSHMSHAYMVKNPSDVSGWVSLGMPSEEIYDYVKAPVLDVYGANDLPQVLAGATKRKTSLKGNAASKQTIIPNADHFYASQEEVLVKTVKSFLDSQK
jgi:pimeloyl-ACP methyl ester carboxylesterase